MLPAMWLLILGCTGKIDADDSASTIDDTGPPGGSSACTDGAGIDAGSHIRVTEGTSYHLYVPATLEECAPLVLFLHGGARPGDYQDGVWSDSGTDLVNQADARGFAVLVPGVEEGTDVRHDWTFDAKHTMDAMITEVEAGLDLDRNRTWAMGTSAGGHMTVWWALDQPELLNAVGVSSAGIGAYFDYPNPAPERKLPFYVAHDPKDTVVDYAFSEQLAADLDANGHTYTFVDWELGQGNHHGWNRDLAPAMLDWFAKGNSLAH